MKTIWKNSLLMTLLFVSYYSFSQKAEHVILVSVDGFRPDFYLDSEWQTTHMHQLMKEGSYAKGVNSVLPSMTYPSHTTMVTGVQPAKHGVYFNNMFEPGKKKGLIYWYDTSIHSPTLWEAVQKTGRPVSSVFWPVSAGAPVQYNIPDVGSLGETIRAGYSTPKGFIDTLKTELFHDTGKINYGSNIAAARIAAYVIEKSKPALLTIHLFAVDHYEHEEGRSGPTVHKVVKDSDSAVAIIKEALKKAGILNTTALIVTGDHGFVDVKTNVNPNVWLHDAGLCNNPETGDWKAQFNSVGGSSFLYVRNNDVAITKQVMNLLDTLPEEKKKLFAIVNRKTLDSIGGNPLTPFALTGLNGTSFGNNTTGEDVKPGHGGTHGYLPGFKEIQTGFIAAGAGVAKGKVIEVMNERDICSVVASLLNISFPSSEGKVPAGLLKK